MSQYRAAVGDFVTNVEIEGAAKAANKGTRFSKAKDLTKRLRGWTPWLGDTAVFDARLFSALAKMPAVQKDTDDSRKAVRMIHHFMRQIASEHEAGTLGAQRLQGDEDATLRAAFHAWGWVSAAHCSAVHAQRSLQCSLPAHTRTDAMQELRGECTHPFAPRRQASLRTCSQLNCSLMLDLRRAHERSRERANDLALTEEEATINADVRAEDANTLAQLSNEVTQSAKELDAQLLPMIQKLSQAANPAAKKKRWGSAKKDRTEYEGMIFTSAAVLSAVRHSLVARAPPVTTWDLPDLTRALVDAMTRHFDDNGSSNSSGSGGGGVERGIGGLSGGVLQCMCATAARHACVAALHLVSILGDEENTSDTIAGTGTETKSTDGVPFPAAEWCKPGADAAGMRAVALSLQLAPHVRSNAWSRSFNCRDPLFMPYWLKLCGALAFLPKHVIDGGSEMAAADAGWRAGGGHDLSPQAHAEATLLVQKECWNCLVAVSTQPVQKAVGGGSIQHLQQCSSKLEAALLIALGYHDQDMDSSTQLQQQREQQRQNHIFSSSLPLPGRRRTSCVKGVRWPAPILRPLPPSARHAPKPTVALRPQASHALLDVLRVGTDMCSATLLHRACRAAEQLARRLGPRLDSDISIKERRDIFSMLCDRVLPSRVCGKSPHVRYACLRAMLWMLPAPASREFEHSKSCSSDDTRKRWFLLERLLMVEMVPANHALPSITGFNVGVSPGAGAATTFGAGTVGEHPGTCADAWVATPAPGGGDGGERIVLVGASRNLNCVWPQLAMSLQMVAELLESIAVRAAHSVQTSRDERRDRVLLPLLLRLLLHWYTRRACEPCTALMRRVWRLAIDFSAAARQQILMHVLAVLDYRPGNTADTPTTAAAVAQQAMQSSDESDVEDGDATDGGNVTDTREEFALVPLHSYAIQARRDAFWFLAAHAERLAELAHEPVGEGAAEAAAVAAEQAIIEASKSDLVGDESEQAQNPLVQPAGAAVDLLGMSFDMAVGVGGTMGPAVAANDFFGIDLDFGAPATACGSGATGSGVAVGNAGVALGGLDFPGSAATSLGRNVDDDALLPGPPSLSLPNQAISTVIDRLWHGATFEDDSTRRVCVEGLAQLALRAKEPVRILLYETLLTLRGGGADDIVVPTLVSLAQSYQAIASGADTSCSTEAYAQ